ncbi:hypothetical protein BC832DRAFT_613284 [Gaertneriomyces semiglobifer]|nr:hypothetical protein BC832DRAFT_613284 [Gaertneriomyces semiglobifer]
MCIGHYSPSFEILASHRFHSYLPSSQSTNAEHEAGDESDEEEDTIARQRDVLPRYHSTIKRDVGVEGLTARTSATSWARENYTVIRSIWKGKRHSVEKLTTFNRFAESQDLSACEPFLGEMEKQFEADDGLQDWAVTVASEASVFERLWGKLLDRHTPSTIRVESARDGDPGVQVPNGIGLGRRQAGFLGRGLEKRRGCNPGQVRRIDDRETSALFTSEEGLEETVHTDDMQVSRLEYLSGSFLHLILDEPAKKPDIEWHYGTPEAE